MRSERPGRDGPGPVLRGGTSVNRGRSSFNDRDEGRPMVMNDQVSSHSEWKKKRGKKSALSF